jgi:cytochrome c peroxidase
LFFLALVSLSAGLACGPQKPENGDDGEEHTDIDPENADEFLRAKIDEQGIEPLAPAKDHPDAKVELGRALFFDRILSGNKDTSCASCHHPSKMTSDELPLGAGTKARIEGDERFIGDDREWIPRNATDLYNRGHEDWDTMFWDNRIRTTDGGHILTPAGSRLPDGLDGLLAAQAMFPVLSRDEMRGDRGDLDVNGEPNELAATVDSLLNRIWTQLMDRLLAIPEYRQMFAAAYPDTDEGALGFQHAANALAAFQEEAFTFTDSPWDRYVAGEEDALSEKQKRGAVLFYGKADCADCHTGTLMTDQQAYNLCVPQFGPGKDPDKPLDLGWGRVINDPKKRFAFRTPSLRNVALTAPYMHNGAYDSLEETIRHHLNADQMLHEYTGDNLRPDLREELHDDEEDLEQILATADPAIDSAPKLSDEEIDDLVAFMGALTAPGADDLEGVTPDSVPSGLPLD